MFKKSFLTAIFIFVFSSFFVIPTSYSVIPVSYSVIPVQTGIQAWIPTFPHSGIVDVGMRQWGAVYAYSEQTFFIHQDNLGSVVAVTSDATVSAQMDYASYGDSVGDAYMRPLQQNNVPKATERGYTGQIQDSSTSLQYYNARYYEPVLSRFISADSVEGGNRYAYVGGNPISRNDPNGNIKIDEGGGNIVSENNKNNDPETSFGSDFFTKLAEEKLFSNKTLSHEWIFEMSAEEKVGILSNFVQSIRPYAPMLGKLAEARAEIEKMNDDIWVQYGSLETMNYGWFKRRYNEFYEPDWIQSKINVDIQKKDEALMFVIRNDTAYPYLQLQTLKSPIKRYTENSFVCEQYAALLGAYIVKYVKNVDVYGVVVPVALDSRTSHALVAVDFRNGEFKFANPTPSWNSRLISYSQLLKEMSPNFDFSKIRYINFKSSNIVHEFVDNFN